MFSFYDGVEGETWIFNRYAYLGVSPEAPRKDIEAAIKKARGENHPDRILRAGKKVQATAEQAWNNIEKCEAILLDEEKRRHFDERLQWFKNNKPHLVSDTGIEKLDPTLRHVDLNLLLRQETFSLAEMKEQIDSVAGVDEKTVRVLKRLCEADTSDAEAREAYTEALAKKIKHITAQEDMAWMNAGVYGYITNQSDRVVQDAHYYADSIAEEISDFSNRVIPMTVANRALEEKKGLAQPIALLPAPDALEAPPPSLALTQEGAREKATEMARETFMSRTHAIKEIAAKKQETMLALLALCPTHEITPGGIEPTKAEIFLLRREETGDPKVVFSVTIEKEKPAEIHAEARGKSLREIKEHPPAHPTYAIEHNPVLDPISQVTYCYKKHCLSLPEKSPVR